MAPFPLEYGGVNIKDLEFSGLTQPETSFSILQILGCFVEFLSSSSQIDLAGSKYEDSFKNGILDSGSWAQLISLWMPR